MLAWWFECTVFCTTSRIFWRSVRCRSSITCNVSGISGLEPIFTCLMRASTNTILCSDYCSRRNLTRYCDNKGELRVCERLGSFRDLSRNPSPGEGLYHMPTQVVTRCMTWEEPQVRDSRRGETCRIAHQDVWPDDILGSLFWLAVYVYF